MADAISSVISPTAVTMESKTIPVRARQLQDTKAGVGEDEELAGSVTLIDESIEAANEEIAKEIEQEEDAWQEKTAARV